MAKKPKIEGFEGVAFDIVEETIIETSSVIRATEDEAYNDAKELCELLGLGEEAAYVRDLAYNAIIFG